MEQPQHTCVVGLAWGDEGKGKVVDVLCGDFDVVVRYNGGANAGHTVCIGSERFALHLLPAGLLREHVVAVIGPGVVVDPEALIAEIDALESRGIRTAGRLKISDRAHLVMPYHQFEDRLSESIAMDGVRIGTTARGIGPCYADKMLRCSAIRMVDLLDLPRHAARIGRIVETKQAVFRAIYGEDGGLDQADVLARLQAVGRRLGPMIVDASSWLLEQVDSGKRLFFEGANGMLLDVDHGTYPFVTSSHTGPQGVAAGAGVPPTLVGRRIGVTKAYATRVGAGPFPTELQNETGDRIRIQGNEFGTTTGRPRRCGWLDAVALRSNVRMGAITDVAMTHLDTLSGFERIGVCVGYRLDGRNLEQSPASADALDRVEPVYEMHDGWPGLMRDAADFAALPAEVRAYVIRIEELVGAPVSIISVGPERTETIIRTDVRQSSG